MKKNLKNYIDKRFDYGFDFNEIADSIPSVKKKPIYRKPVFIGAVSLTLIGGITLGVCLPSLLKKDGKTPTVLTDIRLNEVVRPYNSEPVSLSDEYLTSIGDFTSDFFAQLNSERNRIFSPLSIMTCYSMLLEGCAGDSKTQLSAALHIDDLDKFREETKKMLENTSLNAETSVLEIAQSIWADSGFSDLIWPSYLDCLSENYYAEGYRAKLNSDEAKETLADWINEKTRNFLDVEAKDFKDYGGVVWLLNTIYLKSSWASSFNESADVKGTFTNLDKSLNEEITFMSKIEEGLYYSDAELTLASLNLSDGLKVNFLLPNRETDASAILNGEKYLDLLLNQHTLAKTFGSLNIRLPQFKMMQSIGLVDIMKNLGATDIFDESKANLGNLADLSRTEGNLYVSKSKHEAGIEFTHTGVEAAAYTIIDCPTSSAPSQSKSIEFYLDRPFLFTVTDRIGIPLFVGSVSEL